LRYSLPGEQNIQVVEKWCASMPYLIAAVVIVGVLCLLDLLLTLLPKFVDYAAAHPGGQDRPAW
jgi:hypothetical protein